MILVLANPQHQVWVFWTTRAPTEEELRFLPVGWSVTYFDIDKLPKSLQIPTPDSSAVPPSISEQIMQESARFFLQVGTGMARDKILHTVVSVELLAGFASKKVSGRFWFPFLSATNLVINAIDIAYDTGAAVLAVKEEVTKGSLNLHFDSEMAANMGTEIDVIEYTEASGNVPDPGAGLAVWEAAQKNKWLVLGGLAVAATGFLVWRWYQLGKTEKAKK